MENAGGEFEIEDVKEDWEVAMKCINVIKVGNFE